MRSSSSSVSLVCCLFLVSVQRFCIHPFHLTCPSHPTYHQTYYLALCSPIYFLKSFIFLLYVHIGLVTHCAEFFPQTYSLLLLMLLQCHCKFHLSFEIRLSSVTPSTFLQAFFPSCMRRRTPTFHLPSP